MAMFSVVVNFLKGLTDGGWKDECLPPSQNRTGSDTGTIPAIGAGSPSAPYADARTYPTLPSMTDMSPTSPPAPSRNTSLPTNGAEYALALLSVGLAVALTQLIATDAGTSLFLGLAAVAVTANYCSLRPRLLAGLLASLYAAYHLPPDGTLLVAANYLKQFALFVVVTGFLCIDGAQRLQARRIPTAPRVLPRPAESPEAILDREIKRVASATGSITLAGEEVYDWMRQCAHFRDLVWNIDGSWRCRDWAMLSHSITLAYGQVSEMEQQLLAISVAALTTTEASSVLETDPVFEAKTDLQASEPLADRPKRIDFIRHDIADLSPNPLR
jgi:hypothetical protein